MKIKMKNKKTKKIFILTTALLVLLVSGAFVSNALKQSAVSEGGLVGYWSLAESDLYTANIFQDLLSRRQPTSLNSIF